MTSPDDVPDLRALLLDTAPQADPASTTAMFEATFAAQPDRGASLLPDETFLAAGGSEPPYGSDDADAPDLPHDHTGGGPDDPAGYAHEFSQDVDVDLQTDPDTGHHSTAGTHDTGWGPDQGHHDPGDLTWGS